MNRQRDRKTDRKTERKRDRKKKDHRQVEIERQKDRKTERQRNKNKKSINLLQYLVLHIKHSRIKSVVSTCIRER